MDSDNQDFFLLLDFLRTAGHYNTRIEYAFYSRYGRCRGNWTRENIIQKIEEVIADGDFEREFTEHTRKGAA